MTDKKAVGPGAYPGAPPQPPTFVQGPPQSQSNQVAPPTYGGNNNSGISYVVPTTAAYGVFPTQTGQLYAAQGPPPPYEQALAHPAMIGQQVYPPGAATAMYAGYPGYLSYPAAAAAAAAYAAPAMQYYPSLAYTYPPVQPAHLRPTIMIPNAFDGGARFDGLTQQVIPPNPPGVPPSAAQIAAIQAGHQIALAGQKKNTFLTGSADPTSPTGYTFW